MVDKNWSEGLLGNPLFMMGLGGLGNSKNPFGGMMGGLLAQNQYQQNGLNRASQAEMHDLKMAQIRQQMELAGRPAERKITNDVNGYPRYQNTGERVYPNAGDKAIKPAAMPGAVQRYQFAVSQGFDGSFVDYQTQMKKAGASTVNLNDSGQARIVTDAEKVRMNLDPKQTFVWNSKGMPTAIKSSSFTADQLQSSTFADQMEQAETRLSEITGAGFDPASLQQKISTNVTGGNYLLDGDAQVYQQAKENWVRAKLRKESGAVIGADEMASEFKTFFPQPGDTPEVIAAKKNARAVATRGMITMSGGHYKGIGAYDKKDAKPEPEAEIEEVKEINGVRYMKKNGEWFTE